MLTSIFVKNLILIDHLEVDFTKGLTVFTGETGAGKSIIFDCLMFSLGTRVRSGVLKNSDEKGTVCSQFDISAQKNLKKFLDEKGLLDNEYTLTLRRDITTDGKSKAYINDIPCTVSQLLEVKEYLIEVCGQHDNKGLLDNSNHILLLDKYAELDSKLYGLQNSFTEWKDAQKNLDSLKQKLDKSDIEKDYLQSVISDLENLDLQVDEEDKLIEKRKFLQSAARLKTNFEESHSGINDTILPELYRIQKSLSKDDEFFKEPLSILETSVIELEECSSLLSKLSDRFGNEDSELEEIETRLFEIKSLARRYMINTNMLFEFLESKRKELSDIENANEVIEIARKKVKEKYDQYYKLAKEVSIIRRSKIPNLCNAVNSNFKDLKLENASFKIDIENHNSDNNFTAKGIDKISFLIQTNIGSHYDMISKIASGGELSRFLLAIKVATIGIKSTDTIIFDEIDTGVSGATSHSIGKKLSSLSKSVQIIVITHQPQVAAFSNSHFKVTKIANYNKTSIELTKLENNLKVEEVARLISGKDLSNESVNAAKKLIEEAC